MRKVSNYILVILLFFVSFCYGLNGENVKIQTANNPIVKSDFNLNSLYTKGHYSTLDDNIVYDPARVKLLCPEIANEIISDVPADQNPNLKPSDCDPDATDDMHLQMMGGCDPAQHGDFGSFINSLVVQISIPTDTGTGFCSGTVIGKKWVLSAAHCFTNYNDQFYRVLENKTVYINKQYPVRTIYISQYYAQGAAISNDIAILELKDPLPSRYKPVKLATQLPPSGVNVPIWIAGYGGNQELRYRKQYFMTNIYDSNWPQPTFSEHKSGNINELYISGTKPTLDPNSHQMIAWQFSVGGDSGGPVLLHDILQKEYTILGVDSYGFGCKKTAALIAVPRNYVAYTSVPAYYNFIYTVINGTVNPNIVKTISPDSSKPFLYTYFSLLTLSKVEKKITNYYINNNKRYMSPKSEADTGDFPSAIATTSKYAFITNYYNDTITRYKLKGADIEVMEPPVVLPDAPTDIKIINNYAFVAAYHSNKLLMYHIHSNNGTIKKSRKVFNTGSKPVSIATASLDGINHYIFVANSASMSVSVYKFNSQSRKMEIINMAIKLSALGGMPLKILADGPYVFVQGTQGIGLYLFNGDELEFKSIEKLWIDPGANSDMILLPGIKPPFGLLAVSSGMSSPAAVYDVDFADFSLHFNTFLPIRGTGMAAYFNSNNHIMLHIANAAEYKQRTMTVFDIFPQSSIKEKLNVEMVEDYQTSAFPTKVVIQPHIEIYIAPPPGFGPNTVAKNQ